MTYEEFVEIHQNDTPAEKLVEFAREVTRKADDKVNRIEASWRRNDSDVTYYDREVLAHDKRAGWLFKELSEALDLCVSVVRCRDCVHAKLTCRGECKYCDFWQDPEDGGDPLYLGGDFFCAAGERREEE